MSIQLNAEQQMTLAKNVAYWLDGNHQLTEQEQEDHVLALLRNFGVITCRQEDRAYIEPASREHGLAHIFIGDEILTVERSGKVYWN